MKELVVIGGVLVLYFASVEVGKLLGKRMIHLIKK